MYSPASRNDRQARREARLGSQFVENRSGAGGDGRRFALGLGGLLLGSIGCAHQAPPPVEGEYAVYFLAARGDSMLIDAGDTEIVIDGGLDPEPLRALVDRTVTDGTVELLIVTHVDFDHWKGLAKGALRDVHVAEVWDPGYVPMPTRFLDEAGYDALLQGFADDGARRWRPLAGDPLPSEPRIFGDVSVEFLHPKTPPKTQRGGRAQRISGPNAFLNNNASIVVRVEIAGRSFLFTGDINGDPGKRRHQHAAAEAEGGLLARHANLNADVIKVPHHGSPTSSTIRFIRAVSPEYAIVPYRFTITRREVVDRYRDALCPGLSRRKCTKVLLTRRRTVRCSVRGGRLDCSGG